MKPKIPQQLFKNESAATPVHDDMFGKEDKEEMIIILVLQIYLLDIIYL